MKVLQRPWGHMLYCDQGAVNAPALVFANSLGTDLRMWSDVANRLPGYRCIGFDMRGHGLSATPAQGWTVEDLAGDIAALMDHLGLAQVVIAGCSVGGMVAQAMAIHHPARCLGLILSNTAAKIGTDESWAARIAAVEGHGIASIAEMVIGRWFSPAFCASPAALPWLTMLLRVDPGGYIGTCRALARADLRAGLAGLNLPVLMLAGSADQSTPPDLVRETATMIRGARVVVFEGSGHIPAIDAPAATAAVIAGFLAEIGHG